MFDLFSKLLASMLMIAFLEMKERCFFLMENLVEFQNKIIVRIS